MIHDLRFWLAEIQNTNDTAKTHRQIMRTIHLNRIAGGICEECDKNINVDIIRDHFGIEEIYSHTTLEGLFDVLTRVLEYRQMFFNCTIHREWWQMCDCQNSERVAKGEPLSPDDIPF